MCQAVTPSFFPKPPQARHIVSSIEAFAYGSDQAKARIALLPDIFGCNPFYRGLAAYLAERGAQVFLINPFAGLDELPAQTHEAAFQRRHKIDDTAFLDRFQTFAGNLRLSGVLGFCLGGLYVFELARRHFPATLVGLYGFPQGLQNKDPLPVPFDYLESVRQPFSMLMARDDKSVGAENVARLEAMRARCEAMDLTIFEGVGHGFLTALDDSGSIAGGAARQALALCEKRLLA